MDFTATAPQVVRRDKEIVACRDSLNTRQQAFNEILSSFQEKVKKPSFQQRSQCSIKWVGGSGYHETN